MRLLAYPKLWPLPIGLTPIILACVPVFLFAGIGPTLEQVDAEGSFPRALFRSYSICIAAMLVGIFLFLSIYVSRRLSGKAVRPVAFLLLAPLFVGEGAVGYVVKRLLTFYVPYASDTANAAAFSYYILLIALYAIMLGQFLYVAISVADSGSDNRSVVYQRSNQLTVLESIRLIESHKWNAVLQLYLLLAVVLVAYQVAVSQYTFKPGLGQMNELWPHVVARYKRELSAINPRYAILVVALTALAVTLTSLIYCIATSRIWLKVVQCQIALFQAMPSILRNGLAWSTSVISWSFMAIVVVVAVLGIGKGGLGAIDIGLAITALLAFSAAFVLCGIAIPFAVRVQLWLASTNRSSLSVILFMLAIGVLVPKHGIGNGVLSLRLVWLTNYDGWITQAIAWILVNVVANLPIGCAYLLFMFSQLPRSRWLYYTLHKAKLTEVIRLMAWPLFRSDIVFLFMFVVLFVWTDYSVGRVFADIIPSLPTLLERASEGRATSVHAASLLLITTTSFACLLLAIFGTHLLKVVRK